MLKGIVYGLLGIGGVGALSLCDICTTPAPLAAGVAPVAAVVGRPDSTALRTVTFHVEGMTCGGCVIGTRTVLTRLDGVKKADVSYEKRQAVVTYDPQKVTVEQMVAAIKQLGYSASVTTS